MRDVPPTMKPCQYCGIEFQDGIHMFCPERDSAAALAAKDEEIKALKDERASLLVANRILEEQVGALGRSIASLEEAAGEMVEALDAVDAWDRSVQHSDPNIPRGLNVGPRAHVRIALANHREGTHTGLADAEAEILELEERVSSLEGENANLEGDYAVLRRTLVTVTMDQGYADLFQSTTDRVARVLRNKPERTLSPPAPREEA